eukprot:gene9679-6775_t
MRVYLYRRRASRANRRQRQRNTDSPEALHVGASQGGEESPEVASAEQELHSPVSNRRSRLATAGTPPISRRTGHQSGAQHEMVYSFSNVNAEAIPGYVLAGNTDDIDTAATAQYPEATPVFTSPMEAVAYQERLRAHQRERRAERRAARREQRRRQRQLERERLQAGASASRRPLGVGTSLTSRSGLHPSRHLSRGTTALSQANRSMLHSNNNSTTWHSVVNAGGEEEALSRSSTDSGYVSLGSNASADMDDPLEESGATPQESLSANPKGLSTTTTSQLGRRRRHYHYSHSLYIKPLKQDGSRAVEDSALEDNNCYGCGSAAFEAGGLGADHRPASPRAFAEGTCSASTSFTEGAAATGIAGLVGAGRSSGSRSLSLGGGPLHPGLLQASGVGGDHPMLEVDAETGELVSPLAHVDHLGGSYFSSSAARQPQVLQVPCIVQEGVHRSASLGPSAAADPLSQQAIEAPRLSSASHTRPGAHPHPSLPSRRAYPHTAELAPQNTLPPEDLGSPYGPAPHPLEGPMVTYTAERDTANRVESPVLPVICHGLDAGDGVQAPMPWPSSFPTLSRGTQAAQRDGTRRAEEPQPATTLPEYASETGGGQLPTHRPSTTMLGSSGRRGPKANDGTGSASSFGQARRAGSAGLTGSTDGTSDTTRGRNDSLSHNLQVSDSPLPSGVRWPASAGPRAPSTTPAVAGGIQLEDPMSPGSHSIASPEGSAVTAFPPGGSPSSPPPLTPWMAVHTSPRLEAPAPAPALTEELAWPQLIQPRRLSSLTACSSSSSGSSSSQDTAPNPNAHHHPFGVVVGRAAAKEKQAGAAHPEGKRSSPTSETTNAGFDISSYPLHQHPKATIPPRDVGPITSLKAEKSDENPNPLSPSRRSRPPAVSRRPQQQLVHTASDMQRLSARKTLSGPRPLSPSGSLGAPQSSSLGTSRNALGHGLEVEEAVAFHLFPFLLVFVRFVRCDEIRDTMDIRDGQGTSCGNYHHYYYCWLRMISVRHQVECIIIIIIIIIFFYHDYFSRKNELLRSIWWALSSLTYLFVIVSIYLCVKVLYVSLLAMFVLAYLSPFVGCGGRRLLLRFSPNQESIGGNLQRSRLVRIDCWRCLSGLCCTFFFSSFSLLFLFYRFFTNSLWSILKGSTHYLGQFLVRSDKPGGGFRGVLFWLQELHQRKSILIIIIIIIIIKFAALRCVCHNPKQQKISFGISLFHTPTHTHRSYIDIYIVAADIPHVDYCEGQPTHAGAQWLIRLSPLFGKRLPPPPLRLSIMVNSNVFFVLFLVAALLTGAGAALKYYRRQQNLRTIRRAHQQEANRSFALPSNIETILARLSRTHAGTVVDPMPGYVLRNEQPHYSDTFEPRRDLRGEERAPDASPEDPDRRVLITQRLDELDAEERRHHTWMTRFPAALPPHEGDVAWRRAPMGYWMDEEHRGGDSSAETDADAQSTSSDLRYHYRGYYWATTPTATPSSSPEVSDNELEHQQATESHSPFADEPEPGPQQRRAGATIPSRSQKRKRRSRRRQCAAVLYGSSWYTSCPPPPNSDPTEVVFHEPF